jgi:hypothetical protein
LKVWRGEKPKAKDTGEVDRSASLMKIGRTIYDAGATRRTVAEALKERDLALGWKCYTNRSDADKQYQNIADKLEVEGRNHYIPIRPNGRNSHSRIGDVNVNESENGSSHHPKRSIGEKGGHLEWQRFRRNQEEFLKFHSVGSQQPVPATNSRHECDRTVPIGTRNPA